MLYAFCDPGAVGPDLYARWLEKIPPFRRAKIDRLRFDRDKVLSLCAYVLLCGCTGKVWPEFSYGANGKPSLPDGTVHFNLSHSKNSVVLGLAGSDIGVDVETVRDFSPAVLKKVFTPSEQAQILNAPDPKDAFFTFWTLKESYIKATGQGLSCPLPSVEFALDETGVRCSDPRFQFWTGKTGAERISACSHEPQELRVVTLGELGRMWDQSFS